MDLATINVRNGYVINSCLFDSPDIRDKKFAYKKSMLFGASIPLDWRQYDGLVVDQGTEGSCVGYGGVAVHQALYNKTMGKLLDESERMCYNYAKKCDEYPGDQYE